MSKTKIASGILIQGNQILLCLRQNKKVYSKFWTFPGGKVEENEEPKIAITRELKEEIGIDVVAIENPFTLEDWRGEHEHHISVITDWKGKPENMETELCASIGWFPIDDIPEPVIPVCKRAILEHFYPYSIRKAKQSEAEEISALIRRSKSYWGYDEHFMQLCMNELTASPSDINKNPTFVIEDDKKVIGVHMLSHFDDTTVEMEFLFVEPEWMGKGIGSQLVEHAKVIAQSLGYKEIEIQADPFAQKFYEFKGARKIGVKPSASIPGRVLPVMKIELMPIT